MKSPGRCVCSDKTGSRALKYINAFQDKYRRWKAWNRAEVGGKAGR